MTLTRDVVGDGMIPPDWYQASDDRPKKAPLPVIQIWEFGGSLAAAAAATLLIFTIAGLYPAFGMVVVGALIFLVVYGLLIYLRHGVLEMKNRLGALYVWIGASIALFPLVEMIGFIAIRGMSVVFAHFPAFIVHDQSTGGPTDPVWTVGVGHAIVGSLEQIGLASLFTIPVSIMTATYLVENDTVFSRMARTIVDAMMGLPSIIAGLFIYLWWVQPKHTNGYSGFAAAMALSVLMLPIMIRTAEEVLRVVPGSLREAALALGAPRWRVTTKIILPTALSGLVTAVILGVALGVGETAPVLFTALGNNRFNWNPFSGPQQNLPLEAFELIRSSSPNQVREGYGAAFVLVFLVLSLFVVARYVSRPGRGQRKLFRKKSKEIVTS